MTNEPHQTPAPTGRLDISRRDTLGLTAAAITAIFAGLPVARAAAADAGGGAPLEILFAIYPKGTLLDFAGPNEVFVRRPNVNIRFASPSGGAVTLETGVVIGAPEKLSEIGKVDLLCVP